ncbi:MAG: transposase [Pirellulales bacterium]
MPLTPLYTAKNCSFSCPLQWGLSIFWRTDVIDNGWFHDLSVALEGDGIRLLGHRFAEAGVSQFVISTQPHVVPLTIVKHVKGRLQHLVRDRWPKALKRNYALRSFGHVTRELVEAYVASQLGHHQMADPRVQERLRRFQIRHSEVDLSQPRQTSHGLYWYNLHIVLVHRDRWSETREDVLQRVHDMILKVCGAKDWLLSRAAVLTDHVHLALGCTIDVAPVDVALSFLNNLAYVHGIRPVYQFGGFLGTFGEYDQRAVKSQTPPHPDKQGGGGEKDY